MTSGISNELWTAANIRGSIECESHGIHISFTFLSVYQVGKVSYYEGSKPLAGHKEKREFAKALGKNKVQDNR